VEELVLFNNNLRHKLGGTVGESVSGLFTADDASASSGESIHTHEGGDEAGELLSPMDESFDAGTDSSRGIEESTGNSLSVEHTSRGSSHSHGHNDQVDPTSDDGDHFLEVAGSAKSSESLRESLHKSNGVGHETPHGISPQEGGTSSYVSSNEMSDDTHSSSHSLHEPLQGELERPDDQARADTVLSSESMSAAEGDAQGHGDMENGSTESEGMAYDKR